MCGGALNAFVRGRPIIASGKKFDQSFWYDVMRGLSLRPRSIPARWLYDRRGSELFEAITTLPEYYPTRTERSILSKAADEIASLTGTARAIIEFGAGSAAKTPILLSALNPSAYVPIDISVDFLRETVARLCGIVSSAGHPSGRRRFRGRFTPSGGN